jgi:hypothetical protein
MADSTKEYEVVANSVGVITGVNPRDGIDIVRYHSKGEKVQLTAEAAERLLNLTPPAVVDPAEKKAAEDRARKRAEAEAEEQRLAAEAEVERVEAERAEQEKAAAANQGDGAENLTPKQKLQKEAGELGLDTEGTVPELQKRIDEKKAADAARS